MGMTREEEAIKALKWFKAYNEEDYCGGDRIQDEHGDWYYRITEQDFEAFDTAIKALEQKPTTKNDLGVDCIRRDDVWDVMQELWGTSGELMDRLMALPSVTPQEPRKGHWIKGYTYSDGEYWKCDKCNKLIKVKYPMYYCNNCGSDNSREVEE